MPSISGLVSAISNDVVAKLAAAGYPALTDGAILMGRQHIYEQSSPPRIVFVPVSSAWLPRAMYSRSNVQGAPSAESVLQTQERSIATEAVHFEVHVWGQASPPDPNADFDVTQALYQQVIASVHLLAVGSYKLTGLTWTDEKQSGSQLFKAGHEAVFGLELMTPVLDHLLPLVPSGTVANITTYLQPSDLAVPKEIGCEG